MLNRGQKLARKKQLKRFDGARQLMNPKPLEPILVYKQNKKEANAHLKYVTLLRRLS